VSERPGAALTAGEAAAVARLVEQAFDYRGDVTVVLADGTDRVGYVFNRDAEVARPFLEMFPAAGGDVVTIPYADVRDVRFTGRDTAAGNSYAAWRERRAAARASTAAPDA
jgi:hypothetical protein